MKYPDHLYTKTITIKRKVDTKDSGGSVISTYSEIGTVSCNIQPIKSSDFIKAGRQWESPILRIYANPTEDINIEDKVLYDDKEFQIRELNTWDVYVELIISR